jgi:hypothetical protein
MAATIHHFGRNEKQSRERLKLATARLRIYLWNEKREEERLEGFSFAVEFSHSGTGLYLSQKINPGTQVRLAFEDPNGTAYRGNVVWCNRYSLGQKFIGREALEYRLGIKLQFGSEAERQRYLKYTEEVKARILQIRNAA